MIEKNLVQTFFTQHWQPELVETIDRMRALNPGHRYLFFTDDDILAFIREHYEADILRQYRRLAVGSARADFFRYLVLYRLGGAYCDMDSTIDVPIAQLLHDTDEALLTREGNRGAFVQWVMFYRSGHRLLAETIRLVMERIRTVSGPLDQVTGPPVLSEAVRRLYGPDVYDQPDEVLNAANPDARFDGVDYGGRCTFKHPASRFLYHPYTGTVPWQKNPGPVVLPEDLC